MTKIYIEWLLGLVVVLVAAWLAWEIVKNIVDDVRKRKISDNLRNKKIGSAIFKTPKQKWLFARKRLAEFLDARPYIGHSEAQKLLSEEIAAYRQYLKTKDIDREDQEYLNYLLSLKNKTKQARPYLRRIK